MILGKISIYSITYISLEIMYIITYIIMYIIFYIYIGKRER